MIHAKVSVLYLVAEMSNDVAQLMKVANLLTVALLMTVA